MEKKYTEKDLIEKVSEAHKQRGKYLAYIVGELERAGFKGFAWTAFSAEIPGSNLKTHVRG